MKVAYFDCVSGISGDMCLGALVDAGVPLGDLRKELKKLKVSGYSLSARALMRAGLSATRVNVRLTEKAAPARTWADARRLVDAAALSAGIRKKGLRIIKSMFLAEAEVHGTTLQKAHLHELGAVDVLVDVFGTLICLERLGIKKVYASAINVGSGTVRTAHGTLPVPAPATAVLLKGLPVYGSEIGCELTTPTGAAIIRGVASGFGPMPRMVLETVAMGAGGHDFADRPNVLRVLIGAGGAVSSGITMIETNIDDMNPQVYEHVCERLFKAGALDVSLTQIMMKKGRPGVTLTLMCADEKRQGLEEILFTETTTIGLRHWPVGRTELGRTLRSVSTPFGEIRVKDSVLDGRVVQSTPEYEDCRKAAKRHGVSLLMVMKLAQGK